MWEENETYEGVFLVTFVNYGRLEYKKLTLSVETETCGTIVELYFAVPDIFLFPPSISGSKFCKDKASPGLIVKTSLFKTSPP